MDKKKKLIIKYLLFILLIIITVLGSFLIISIIFKDDVTLDKAKLLEEFSKSIVAIIILILTMYFGEVKNKIKSILKSKSLKIVVITSLNNQISHLKDVANYKKIFFDNLPLLEIKSNYKARREFVAKINLLLNVLEENKKLIINNEISVLRDSMDYFLLINKLEVTIKNYLSSPSEINFNSLKNNSQDLLQYINESNDKLSQLLVKEV